MQKFKIWRFFDKIPNKIAEYHGDRIVYNFTGLKNNISALDY